MAIFLSTFPLRGTSCYYRFPLGFCHDFYPRSPCGERQLVGVLYRNREWDFYPRSPCGERRIESLERWQDDSFLSTFPLRGTSLRWALNNRLFSQFLSTFPLRGTSKASLTEEVSKTISIHVPLAGNVRSRRSTRQASRYFYPRSPCGERR